jgi:hypothetical protein
VVWAANEAPEEWRITTMDKLKIIVPEVKSFGSDGWARTTDLGVMKENTPEPTPFNFTSQP